MIINFFICGSKLKRIILLLLLCLIAHHSRELGERGQHR